MGILQLIVLFVTRQLSVGVDIIGFLLILIVGFLIGIFFVAVVLPDPRSIWLAKRENAPVWMFTVAVTMTVFGLISFFLGSLGEMAQAIGAAVQAHPIELVIFLVGIVLVLALWRARRNALRRPI